MRMDSALLPSFLFLAYAGTKDGFGRSSPVCLLQFLQEFHRSYLEATKCEPIFAEVFERRPEVVYFLLVDYQKPVMSICEGI